MSTRYETSRRFEATWPLAAVAGLVAGLVRPVAVAVLTAAGIDVGALELTLQHELPYWWAIHFAYSFAFGAVYGLIASWDRVQTVAARPLTGAAVGVLYGIALWALNVVVLWTVITALLPLLASNASLFGPLLGHLVYGAVLGGLYPLLVGSLHKL